MVPFGWRQCWQERCRAGYFLAGAFGAGGEGGGVEGSGAHHALAIEGVTGRARALFRDTRLLLASASRVLMSTARRRVDAGHAPGEPAREVRVGLDGTQDPVPRAVRRPTPVPFTNGLTAARTLGKVPPRHAGPDPEQDPVDHPAVIAPASPRSPDAGECGSNRPHSAFVRSPRPMPDSRRRCTRRSHIR